MIEDEKCSVLVLHHSPKMEYEELVNRAASSSLIARWADVIIGMKRINKKDRKDPRRTLEFLANSGDEPDDVTVKLTGTGIEETNQPNFSKLSDALDILEKDLIKNPKIGITKRIKDLHLQYPNISERTFWSANGLI